MVERRASHHAVHRLAQRAYLLRPARPLAVRIALWASVFALGVAAGVAGAAAMAGIAGWFGISAIDRVSPEGPTASTGCVSEPPPADGEQAELARTRLALAQESAARAAVQKTADRAAAELARLAAELQFLRNQSKRGTSTQGQAPH